MKFFKENSYDIVKLLLNQIGIAIFSLAVYVAPSADDGSFFAKFAVYLSLLAVVFYFVLIYITAWDFGIKDKMRYESGKIQLTKNKGLKLGFFANIPNFVLAGIAIVLMLIYLASGNEVLYSLFFTLNLFIRFTGAMFLGLIQGVFSFLKEKNDLYYLWQTVGYFVVPILTILVTHLGYELGRRDVRIFGFINLNKNTDNQE